MENVPERKIHTDTVLKQSKGISPLNDLFNRTDKNERTKAVLT
jgi:hypothetical protein